MDLRSIGTFSITVGGLEGGICGRLEVDFDSS